ncbi:hypothetical protein P9317_19315, partial [Paenibacillus validus]|nr:hypothetical protein [Paenibacillus validus]
KESGMHAVEDYLMSRYQMYWQVYFHPVTRSAEVVLHKIFQRAKQLFEEGYPFHFLLEPLPSLFGNRLTTEEYHLLDEALMQTVLMQWTMEEDAVLADLCSRFLQRRLFKYVTLEIMDVGMLERLREKMGNLGLDPSYYLEVDFPSDQSYDVYRPGEQDEKLPILLLDAHDTLTEISRKSEIVRSISGIQNGKYHL